MRYRLILKLLSVVWGLFSSPDNLTSAIIHPPFLINCGGSQSDEDEADPLNKQTDLEGHSVRLLPDRPYQRDEGYGYESGESHSPWYAFLSSTLEDSWNPDWFRSSRVNPEAYLFQLPGGSFEVILGFAETDVHLTGERLFDIEIKGRVLRKRLDCFGEAGLNRPFLLRSIVTLEDPGILEIILRPDKGESFVNFIAVLPYRKDGGPEKKLNWNLYGREGYGMNRLLWNLPEVQGYTGFQIERKSMNSTVFEAVTTTPILSNTWIDHKVEPGREYIYRIGLIHGSIKSGIQSQQVTLKPRSWENSDLPIYDIRFPESDRRKILKSIHEDITAKGTMKLDGTTYPIEIRLHGASTRHAVKKSYRVRFTEKSPIERKVTFLKGQPTDYTLQQEKLSCDLFREAKMPISDCHYINLVINGIHQGVYLDIEPIRSPFKRRAELDPKGTLIRASTFQHPSEEEPPGELRGKEGSINELVEFLNELNSVPRGDFESWAREMLDWPKVRDYFCMSVITHRSEIEANDYFFYRDPVNRKWQLIPWDHNNGNFSIQFNTPSGGESFIHIFPQCLQDLGWRPNHAYVLPSRIFNNPELKSDYLNRLEELTRKFLSPGFLNHRIEMNFRSIEQEVPLDPFRFTFRERMPFLNSGRNLKAFGRNHYERILKSILNEQHQRPDDLVINEFQFTSNDGWVELYNSGNEKKTLHRYSLVAGKQNVKHDFPLGGHPDMRPDEIRVFRFNREKLQGSRLFDDENISEAELAERRELGLLNSYSGFSPDGGLLALVKHVSESDEEGDPEDREWRRDPILDFHYYGKQDPENSYGRTESGFTLMNPTPGLPNESLEEIAD